MSLQLYANPYDTSAKGFYFGDFDEYEKKAEKAVNDYGDPVEEFEIEFIDGDDTEQSLFNAMNVSQANLEDYFETLDDLDEKDIQKLSILMDDMSYDFSDAMDKKDDLIVWGEFSSDKDFAYEYVDGFGSLGDALGERVGDYFDYDSFGRDLRMDGYGYRWIVNWETADDSGELDEEFDDYEEAVSAGEEWQDEAEGDGEEDASFEVEEKGPGMSDQELGEEYVDSMGGPAELDKQTQENYFDWERYARDLMFDMSEYNGIYYDPNSI